MGASRIPPLGASAAVLLVLGVAAAISAWILAGGRPVGLFSDSIAYLDYADFYRGMFTGDAAPGIVEQYRSSRYPPLFPLLLALFNSGADHALRALWVTNVLALLATAALWLWLRRELGQAWVAALAAVAVVLTPAWILWLLEPASEPLLLLLTLGACALAAERSDSRALAVAAMIGLMPLARMAGLPFVASGLLWLWRRRDLRLRTRALASGLMLLPAAAWLAYRSVALSAESYVGAVIGRNARLQIGDPGAWLAEQARRVVDGIGQLWQLAPGGLTTAFAVVLLVLAGVGAVMRLRRNTIDAAYLPCYLALVLAWPYPAETERLLVVIVPFLLVTAIDGGRVVLAPFASRAPALPATAVPVLLLALALPALARFLDRAATPVDAALAGYQRDRAYLMDPSDAQARKIPEGYLRVQTTIEALPGLIPQGGCVYAVTAGLVRHWAKVSVQPYPHGLADAEQARRELSRCDYFLVAAISTSQFNEPALYPIEQLAGWTQPLLVNSFEGEGEDLLVAAVLQRATGE